MAYELRETAKIQSRVVPVIGYNGKKTYPVTLGSSEVVRLGVLVSGRRGIKKRVIRGDKGEKIRMATQDELRHLYEKQNLKSLIMPAGEEAVKEGRDESVAIIDMPEEGDNEKAEDQFGGETFDPIEEE